MKPVKAFDPKKRKEVTIGKIEGDTFYKNVRNNHYMIKEKGYGLQLVALDRLVREKVKKIVIKTHKGTRLESKMEDWVRWGRKKSYGHGKQMFLSTDFMKEYKIND